MAIKFVDKDPEPARPSAAPSVAAEPDAEALARTVDPELPHAKPKPKQKGRKKPLT